MLINHTQGRVNFEKIREIGDEGKNSKVYLIRDKQFDAELVVKEILKSKLEKDAYFKEAQFLYAASHPNVAPVQYCCEDNDHVYIASPYHPAGSLKRLMSTRYLTAREIIIYATQFLSGVHHIHSKGLIHFDIKPDNILINKQGEAVLSDFGLSRHMNYSGEAEPETLYSKHAPPEALDRPLHLTKQCDIYQVGLTLYRMCNGNDAFLQQLSAITAWPPRHPDERVRFAFAIRNGKFPNRQDFLPHVPDKLRAIVKKSLQPNPTDRYKSATDIVNDLAAIKEGPELDWLYEQENGKRIWHKQHGENEYRLEVDSSNGCKATKKTPRTSQNIRDYCLDTATTSRIREFLKTY